MDEQMQLEQLTESASLAYRLDGAVIGALVGFAEDGAPLIDFPGNPHDSTVRARTAAALSPEEVGNQVILLFEGADPSKPLVVGTLVDPHLSKMETVTVQRDGKRIVLAAEREIVLQCGDASITLTRAGKVLIRGAYVSSHSTGVNKIKGGVVHIN